MPNLFNNARLVCNTSLQYLYTCPSINDNGTVLASVIFLIQVANVTNNADVVTVLWTKYLDSNAVTRLGYQVPVPAQQSIGLLTGKFVMLPGDTLQAQCGIASALEITVSTLETA